MTPLRTLPILLPLTLLLLHAPSQHAHARLQISARATTTTYLLAEPLTINITLVNRTARDLVIGGDTDPQLTFYVRRGPQTRLRPRPESPPLPTIHLPARSTLHTNINLLRHYDMRTPGSYTIRCQIRWNDDIYSSANIFVDIMRGAELVAITSEYEPEATLRRYSIQTLHRDRTEVAFLRIEDATHCHGVIPLGRIIKLYRPDMTADQDGNIHIRFQTGPARFARLTFKGDGTLLNHELLTTEEQHPATTRGARGHLDELLFHHDF